MKIEAKDQLKVQLFDNISTPISPDIFVAVVQSFWNGSGFFINLITENDLDAAKSMVTPDVSNTIRNTMNSMEINTVNRDNSFQILKKYLIDKNASHIFVESESLGTNGKLLERTRRQLVNHLVNFMLHVHGQKITTEQKIATAKAAIILFPCMEVKNSTIGGIVSV